MAKPKQKSHFQKRWLFLLIIPVLVGVWAVINRWDAYLPHKRIIIAVPFDKNNPPDSLIPMGETIFHPKPQIPTGHPGIDFGWNNDSGTVHSSSDGTVVSVAYGKSETGLWDVEVEQWPYLLRYKEMIDYNHDLHKGSKVKTGDLIGKPRPNGGGFHWELASVSIERDRFCPMTYFDATSKKLMETIWANTNPHANRDMKIHFPDICSGDYENKTE